MGFHEYGNGERKREREDFMQVNLFILLLKILIDLKKDDGTIVYGNLEALFVIYLFLKIKLFILFLVENKFWLGYIKVKFVLCKYWIKLIYIFLI